MSCMSNLNTVYMACIVLKEKDKQTMDDMNFAYSHMVKDDTRRQKCGFCG